jgi:hypothetical protein
MTRSHRRSIFTLAFALVLGAACHLDPSGKTGCLSDADCLEGRRCAAGMCEAVSSALGKNDAASGSVTLCDSRSGALACAGADAAPPMTCFQASALGGQDFCAQACDPTQGLPTTSPFACVETGALLPRCHPSSFSSPSADCPEGLNCYRTSVVNDEGLCILMPVCATDADCPSGTYNRCAAQVLTGVSSPSPFIHLDHLNCVHADCVLLQSACASSEGCLATQYSSFLADICAPNCDSNSNCPPNYSCSRSTSGAGSPDLCLPGLPGIRCNGDNCLFGTCEDTGAGFSVCTIPCAIDANCAILNTRVNNFVCVTGGGTSHCVTSVPFNGANCDTTDECRADRSEFCSHVNGFGQQISRGECRVPCNADGTCGPQGGLPTACVGAGAGGCFPGLLGVSCQLSSECIGPLSCQSVPAELDVALTTPQICTTPCGVAGGSDADADAQCAPVAISGYCGGGFCRTPRSTGQACNRNTECASNLCDTTTDTCLTAPASGL